MANKIFHSSQVTFLDRTDERKLDVYISSNHPTVQIKNQNTGEYTPNWNIMNLQLSAEVYIDSQDITNNPQTTLNWYTKIDNKETLAGNGKTLVVSSNVLSSNPIVTYVCKAKYQNIDAISQITFTRTDTGLNGIDGVNGTDGAPAPAVKAQYSINGESGWDATLNASIHKYIRYSYDGGNTWTVAIKMVGEDGTSVNIKGTATSKTAVSGTSYYTLVYDSTTITGATMGDAYLLDGDLYVCVDSRSGNDYFMNVGKIQGPAGNDGRSSYVFIRYATDANGSNMTDSPNSTTTHIGICTVNTNVAPITPSSYIWSKFVGDNAKSIILNGSSQIFKVDSSSAYSPTTITVTAHAINITIAKWEYSINGGASWLSDAPSGVFLNSSTNTITVTGANLDSNSIVIRASNGSYSDTYTVYKVFDGINGTIGKPGDPASMAFLTNENISFSANANGQISSASFTTNVVAYTGTTKVTPTIGTVTGLPTGMTVSAPITTANEQILTFSIANNSTLGSASSNNGTITIPITSPVSTNLKLSWSKINTGATGVGIASTTVMYGVSDSSSAKPADDAWQSTIPTVEDGKYLWTRTVIDYTDPARADTVTYTYAKQGTIGEKGNPGTSVAVTSIQYQEGSSATTAPNGTWQNAVVAAADGKYLWTKTTFSDGKVAYGVAKQGSAGTPASLVNITPSALYFKSTTGANGTFTPQYIYLYPRFQSATYSNWQYSLDGGATWSDASGANGLTISTYNSVANSLRIDRSSTLYTNDVTSISFRCNSTVDTVYDTVSIAKIYDVVDLNVGARNLARFTDSEMWSHYHAASTSTTANVTFSNGTRSTRIKASCIATNTATNVVFGIQQNESARLMKLKSGQTYTLSFLVRGNVANLNYTYLMNTGTENQALGDMLTGALSTTNFVRVSKTFVASTSANNSTGSYLMISYRGPLDPSLWFEIEEAQLEVGNIATDWTPAPEDILEEAANVNVMLSNESHFFEATAGGTPTETSIVLDVVGYKGSIQSATTVGTISGLPSAGMTATVSSNGTTNTKITVAVTSALTSSVADYGTLTIPVTVNGHTINKKFNWVKSMAGDSGQPGGDAVTFQIYSGNGYALSANTPTITLQTFAYIADKKIQSGATYQWYRYNNTNWTAISGATNPYFTISRDDVSFSNSYMCKMQFSNAEYIGVATIDDKNDINKVFTTKPSNYVAGDIWIVGVDYVPTGIEAGTLLKAQHTNSTYADNDWITASKYDKEISEIQKNIDTYNQYFSFNSAEGLKISAKDENGTPSQFSTSLTNERLSFNYGNEAVAYIDGKKMNIKEANIESPLTVTGKYSGSTMLQAPIINIGNFSIVVESNGSLSIVANV